MANPFLTGDSSEIETAILLENAKQCDLGKLNDAWKKAVAFTDGKRVYVNSDNNLAEILPNYNEGMLKWLLWHEEFHKQLKHHNRFFRYLKELDEKETMDKFQVTKDEVNIIMDILVHDSLCKMFPDLVETAISNLAQMRNRNSLGYTFKSFNLEDMLDEYKAHKKGEDEGGSGDRSKEGKGEDDKGEGESKDKTDKDKKDKDKKDEVDDGEKEGESKDTKEHSEGGKDEEDSEDSKEDKLEDCKPEHAPDTEEPKDEHDKTDWSKLKDRDNTEFIDKETADVIEEASAKLKRREIKLGRLTQRLNGLATTTRARTYAMPSYIGTSTGVIIKGKARGRTELYLCFDASGSMGRELETFKEIISKSIPHAMDCPCEWFTDEYGKGTFRDIMPVYADSGFCDDGDRVIELCWKAEQKGFSPIGVTDGGGKISWSEKYLKQLKRTVLVGQNNWWLEMAKEINPRIQTIEI